MAADVGVREVSVRDLRNNTSAVLDEIETGHEVFITRNGVRVAVLRPLDRDWDSAVDEIVAELGEPYDSGLSAILEADDAASLEAENASWR